MDDHLSVQRTKFQLRDRSENARNASAANRSWAAYGQRELIELGFPGSPTWTGDHGSAQTLSLRNPVDAWPRRWGFSKQCDSRTGDNGCIATSIRRDTNQYLVRARLQTKRDRNGTSCGSTRSPRKLHA